ncbi:hypothetical protein ACPTGD_14130, partial [Enterococcus faecalis]|uniref:hypothetical protein n=1 Tax=Enterococcus faecalis TaxID=1351 RepID=UPI003CC6AC99
RATVALGPRQSCLETRVAEGTRSYQIIQHYKQHPPHPHPQGEAIACHLANLLGLLLKDKTRVVFKENTNEAVNAAFKEPRT